MLRKPWFFVGVLIAGCSGIDVSHDYDRNFHFAALKTWSWSPKEMQTNGGQISRVSSLTHERIRSAVDHELSQKKYERVQPEAADFWVRHYAAIGQRIESDSGYDYGWYGQDLRVYDEGTVVIDVITAKDKRLVWRGTARGAIDPSLTPEEREKKVQEVVHEIMADFPPKSSK
jgi:hypothetical protein